MATGSEGERQRRWAGWGFEDVDFEPPAAMLAWLEDRLGPTEPYPRLAPEELDAPPARSLPSLPGPVTTDPLPRLERARGQGLPDLLRLRAGALPAVPDAVAFPADEAAVVSLLEACNQAGMRVIPRGGGTSVTGGVNVVLDDAPTVILDLSHLSGLEELDETSGLATFRAGTTGPGVEAALGEAGFTLGHFPQSWELSTVGGWVATRASGQESLGYGSIADLVAGARVVAPGGRLEIPAFPASAAGPDLRQVVLGSEGRLGVITRATLRVRRAPPPLIVWATVLPTWEAGLEASRDIVQQGVPLHLLRLSNEPETEVAMTVGLAGHRRLAPLVRGWLRLRGIPDRGRGGCLLLLGAAEDEQRLAGVEAWCGSILGRHGGVSLGRRPGRTWVRDRFRHPYLRDALLDRGWATDTLETAAPWSRLAPLAEAVNTALARGLEAEGETVPVLCHVSHPYRDGASLYFTFFFRCPPDADTAVARWARLKRAATDALVEAGGTLSHHHGVGSWHAPWYRGEVGRDGHRLVATAARQLDPRGILQPAALLDPTDRLEA